MNPLQPFASMKSAAFTLTCFVLLFLPSTTAMAQSPSREVTICFGDFRPFEFKDGGTMKGMNVEILETMAASRGITIHWSVYPWARCLYLAKIGNVDGLMSLYRSAEREEFLYFPDEHINLDESVFFTFPGSDVAFDGTLKSLTGMEVLVATANSYGHDFDNAENIIKVEAPNSVNVVRMIACRRYKIGIGSRKAIETEIAAQGYEKNLVILEPPYYIKTYFAFSKKKGLSHKALARDFSDALQSFKKSGGYEQILKKYGYWK